MRCNGFVYFENYQLNTRFVQSLEGSSEGMFSEDAFGTNLKVIALQPACLTVWWERGRVSYRSPFRRIEQPFIRAWEQTC